MADDNNARFRSNDSVRRGPASAEPASDPLAELARLIGRNDPFSDYAREPRAPVPPAPQDSAAHYGADPIPSFLNGPAPQYNGGPEPAYRSNAAPQYRNESAPRYSEPAPQPYTPDPAPHQYGHDPAPHQYGHDPAPQQYGHEPAPQQYGHESSPRYNSEYPAHNDWPSSPAPAPSYPSGSDPFALPPQQQHASPMAAPHYDNQGYASPNYPSQGYADPQVRPGMESYRPEAAGLAPPRYGTAPDRQGFPAPPVYPNEPDAGAMPPPHDDEFYDDARGSRRRRGLLTVVAVLALAVVGTAGAFAYRSMFGGPSSSGPPPVIRASGEPSRVAPPPGSVDQSVGKFSYDRFGDAGKDEQVVRREEKPVDLSKVAPPRSVFPGVPENSPSAKSSTGTAAAANPPSAIGEPRRVRTVPIRPDQGSDVAAAPPAQQPLSVAPPRQASAAVSSVPAATPDDSRSPAPRSSSRVASRSAPSVGASQPPSANAPLSLSPEANNNTLPPPPIQESFPPPRASAVPSRVATASVSGGGGYLVQVSSQRSETDAQSAYRGIQSKFPSLLGNQPHTVRRADLGAKGVYYRAMVGPFASRDEAVQLCSSLKQAGGDCVVQH